MYPEDIDEKKKKVEALYQQSIICLQGDKHDEAINLLTEALQLDHYNPLIYCIRSYTYLKKKMFYLAMQDANDAIILNPNIYHGYLRKAEIEYLIGDYTNCLISYACALSIEKENPKLLLKMFFTNEKRKAQIKARSQIPWLGAGFGIIIAVFVMVTNHIMCSNPFIKNPLLIVLTTILIAVFGFSCGLAINTLKKYQQEQMLKPPKNIKDINIESKENDQEDEQIIKKNKRTKKSMVKRCLKKRKNPRTNYTNLS